MTQFEQFALREAISNRFNRYDSNVRIYEKGLAWDGDKIEFVVNWAATGDRTPKEALKMAHDLKIAAQVCTRLNNKHYIYHWKEGETLTTEEKESILNKYEELIEQLCVDAWSV